MLDLQILNTIRAYKHNEINWEETKTAVEQRLAAIIAQSQCSTLRDLLNQQLIKLQKPGVSDKEAYVWINGKIRSKARAI